MVGFETLGRYLSTIVSTACVATFSLSLIASQDHLVVVLAYTIQVKPTSV